MFIGFVMHFVVHLYSSILSGVPPTLNEKQTKNDSKHFSTEVQIQYKNHKNQTNANTEI